MTKEFPASDAAWTRLEDDFTNLLSRIERRQRLAPATEEDGNLNRILHDNLQQIVRLTSQFAAVRHGHYSLQAQANGLNAVAQASVPVVALVKALENAPPLSPLFERMMNREYDEVVGLAIKMRDAVKQNSEELLAIAEENPPVPVTDPLTIAWNIMMAPYAMAWMMTTSWMAAWQLPAQNSRRNTHLHLAYSRN